MLKCFNHIRKLLSRASRPRYKKEYAEMARQLILLEQNQEQIAKFFDVAASTISNWKKEHAEFRKAIKNEL